jgi:AAA+ superfamily predicted ATPase
LSPTAVPASTPAPPASTAAAPPRDAGLAGILRELERLDALLDRAVQAARERAVAEAGGDPYRGLYVSHEEAEGLVVREPGAPSLSADGWAAPERGAGSPLARLAAVAGLSPFETDLLLIALAPDLDLKYERIYAYLQDDVTRRRPTVDLAFGLLCPSFGARAAARARLSPAGTLRRNGLLHLVEDAGQKHAPLLGRTLKADERVVDWLLGSDEPDPALQHVARAVPTGATLDALLLPEDLRRRLRLMAEERGPGGRPPVFHLQGAAGVGRQALAAALCGEQGLGLLAVDCARLAGDDAPALSETLRLAAREALLRGSGLLLEGWDALLGDDRRAARAVAVGEVDGWDAPTFVAGELAWEPGDALHERPLLRVEVPSPDYADRVTLWTASLNGDGSRDPSLDADALANKFRFTGGQIREAAATARNLARARDPQGGRLTMADLYAACRMHSNPRLAALARKITPRYAWDDIVLPPDRVQQLREITNYVKYRSLVYGEWGFDRKLAMGKGLNALFAGGSGTGKTMAAEIIAGELALDLYKIDLSSVVSKYIGETEKNLSRIFNEAETSNAILFFDEADSMFGKRSEVRDSHDRYANLEISYLLQRMEEYEGVVILATNFRKNMDDAFVRRLHFSIDFPFPAERERLRIWQRVWPERIPRSADVDLEQIARRVEVAGGSIRNIALAAAFLAADEEGVVCMSHLVRATRREYQKMGKVLSDGDLGDLARAG